MVARHSVGGDAGGALRYNLQKVRQQQAKVIEMRNLPAGLKETDEDKLNAYFNILTNRNDKSEKNILHFSVNFSEKDQVSSAQMSQVAEDLIDKINMRGQPALVVQHFDAGHPHFHLVTTSINEQGKRIETKFLGYTLRDFCQEQERKHHWVGTGKNRKPGQSWDRPRIELKKLEYPESNLARKISAIVDSTSWYKFANLKQYNALLSHYNIKAIAIKNGVKEGLMFTALKAGRSVGTPIRSKDLLYSTQFYSRLQQQMEAQGKAHERQGQLNNPFQGDDSSGSSLRLLGEDSQNAYLLDETKREISHVPANWLPEPGSANYPEKGLAPPVSPDYGSIEENQLKKKKKQNRGNNLKL